MLIIFPRVNILKPYVKGDDISIDLKKNTLPILKSLNDLAEWCNPPKRSMKLCQVMYYVEIFELKVRKIHKKGED